MDSKKIHRKEKACIYALCLRCFHLALECRANGAPWRIRFILNKSVFKQSAAQKQSERSLGREHEKTLRN